MSNQTRPCAGFFVGAAMVSAAMVSGKVSIDGTETLPAEALMVSAAMVSGKVSVTGASYRVLRVLRAFPRSNQKCPVLSPAPLRERCLHFCDCHRILKGTLRCLTTRHASSSDLMAKNQA